MHDVQFIHRKDDAVGRDVLGVGTLLWWPPRYLIRTSHCSSMRELCRAQHDVTRPSALVLDRWQQESLSGSGHWSYTGTHWDRTSPSFRGICRFRYTWESVPASIPSIGRRRWKQHCPRETEQLSASWSTWMDQAAQRDGPSWRPRPPRWPPSAKPTAITDHRSRRRKRTVSHKRLWRWLVCLHRDPDPCLQYRPT